MRLALAFMLCCTLGCATTASSGGSTTSATVVKLKADAQAVVDACKTCFVNPPPTIADQALPLLDALLGSSAAWASAIGLLEKTNGPDIVVCLVRKLLDLIRNPPSLPSTAPAPLPYAVKLVTASPQAIDRACVSLARMGATHALCP